MKPETLTALTAARGTSLSADRCPKREELIDIARWFLAGEGKLDGKVRWNLPKGDRSIKKPDWTLAEAGMAAIGVSRRCYIAARYRYALDDSVRGECKLNLLEYAIDQRGRNPEGWPARILCVDGRERQYLEFLVDMHLLEDRAPWRFKDPAIYPTLAQVTGRIWARKLSPLYVTLGQEWISWYSTCMSMMRELITGS